MSKEIEQILKNQIVMMRMLQFWHGVAIIQNVEDTHKLLADKNNGWIPCSERLPEKNTEVIVSFAHGLVDTVRYKDNGIFESIYEYSTDVIKAWQPLPEPYREEQEDEI